MDPDKTAPIGALCSGSTLKSNARELFAADDFSRRHFEMHFFLGAFKGLNITASLYNKLPRPENQLYIYISTGI